MKQYVSPAIGIVGLLLSACGGDANPGPATGEMQGNGTGGTPAMLGTGGSSVNVPPKSSTPSLTGPGGAAMPGTGGASAPAAGAGDAGAADADAAIDMDAAGPASTAACDRSCLLSVLQNYLDALIMHDPSKVPISANLKMTDNGVTAKPGDGLWQTATMLVADERLDYADPVTHNVGSQCVINEGSTPVLYEVRLKVDDAEITEIESMTVRQADAANGFFDPANLKPQPVFLQMPDPGKRMSRDDLMAMQELYLDYLEGKKGGSEVPFDTNCARYENGVATASGVDAFNLQSWSFAVTRRVLIIDEEAGITWGMFPFMQDDTALVVGEAFKMLDGKMMMIQAVMTYMPSKAWD